MGIEPFPCSAIQISNRSCILGVVVGYSLSPFMDSKLPILDFFAFSIHVGLQLTCNSNLMFFLFLCFEYHVSQRGP
jgi:hypothetical protein